MLGAVHWRESSLSRSGPILPSQTSGEWAQAGQAKQCCMLRGNVRMMYVCVVNGGKPLPHPPTHTHTHTPMDTQTHIVYLTILGKYVNRIVG